MIRTGRYGDWFGVVPDGLSLARLGPITPTASTWARSSPACPTSCAPPRAQVELAPPAIIDDLARLAAALDRDRQRDRDGAWCWSAGATCARTTRGCTT